MEEFFNSNYFLPILVIIFSLLENKFPMIEKQNAFQRKHGWADLVWFYFTGQIMLFLPILFRPFMIFSFYRFFATNPTPIFNVTPIVSLILCYIWLDLTAFGSHYASHRYKFLWNIHKLHHSSEHVDWLSAYRNYWLENIVYDFIINLCFFFIFLPAKMYLALQLYIQFSGFFTHTNTRIKMGFLKGWLVGSFTHHWHHSLENKYKYGQNYGIFTHLGDRVFGTLYCPENMKLPDKYGISEEYNPDNLYERIFLPFISRNLYTNIKNKIFGNINH